MKPVQPVVQQSALRSSQPQAPETARASAGEASAANTRTETVQAVKAAEQASVAARLRDNEKAEHSERPVPAKDAPTGPPPAFKESPLERQARVAFDPPDAPGPARDAAEREAAGNADKRAGAQAAPEADDPPPTRSERAEASFAETRTLSAQKEPGTVDVAR